MAKSTVVVVNGVEWTKEKLVVLLETNDSAVIRGMMRIYDFQTEYEKNVEGTVDDNGVGFSGVHGNIMSSYAQFYKKSGKLTVKQLDVARKIMKRYAGQLLRIMEGKQKCV